MSRNSRARLIAAATVVALALAVVPSTTYAAVTAFADEGSPTPEPTETSPAPEPTETSPAPEPTGTPTPAPTPTAPAKKLYGCYVVPWSSAVTAAWSDGSLSRSTAPVCAERGVPAVTPATVTYAKVRWSPTRYALVAYPNGPRDTAVDRVVVLSAKQHAAAGSPAVRSVGHIPTSTYFRYASSASDRYVRTPDGVRHALTAAEYQKAGSPALTLVYGGYYRVRWSSDIHFVSASGSVRRISAATHAAAGSPRVAIAPTVYVKTSYSPVHALVTWPHRKGDRAVDEVVLLTPAQLKKAGSPRAEVRARIPGDSFVRLTVGTTIYHRSQGHLTPVTTAQWRAAGAPTVKTVKPAKPTYIRGILVVNKSLPLPASYGSGLTGELRSGFSKMRAAAARDGVDLRIISGFRSYASQQAVYASKIRQYGFAKAQLRSARPGHSEHQTGLAIDVNSISQAWGKTKAGRWVAKNAHRYGFIVRYPEGKTSVTGFAYEPWHLRYVGTDVATHLRKKNLTLDEYLGVPSRY